jgi:hypothetical protein
MKRTYESIKGENRILVDTSQQPSKVIAEQIANKILSRIKNSKNRRRRTNEY